MTLRGKRVMVTGSDGFVGSYLVRRLEQESAEVIPVDISRGIDVTDWAQVGEYRNIDFIYHLAARANIKAAVKDPRQTYFVNLVGTANMLELARLNRVERFIFASSYVYGNPEYLPVDEGHPLNPPNPYSRSKALGEGLCRGYYEDYGLKCVIIRPFNIYGEGQGNDFLIPSILRQLGAGKIELDRRSLAFAFKVMQDFPAGLLDYAPAFPEDDAASAVKEAFYGVRVDLTEVDAEEPLLGSPKPYVTDPGLQCQVTYDQCHPCSLSTSPNQALPSAPATASALRRFMPSTAVSSSTVSSLILPSEPNSASNRLLRTGPIPSISSSVDRIAARPRTLR